MNDRVPGLLVVWMNVEPSGADDFAEWYIRQHIPERVGVPGFRNGNRYRALEGSPHRGSPEHLAVYDTGAPDVLASAAYKERLNTPTEWTQRVMPMFRDTVRSACRVVAEQGTGLGGVLRTVRVEPGAGGREALREALAALPEPLLAKPGIVRVRLVERVEDDSGAGSGGNAAKTHTSTESAETAEVAMRGKDQSATFTLLVDGTDAASLQAACAELASPDSLTAQGAAGEIHVGDYALMYNLTG